MILKEIPELEAHTSGRDVLLAFAKDVGSVLSQATDYSEALILNKAAKILRRRMISKGFSFGGNFYDGCVEDSLPPALLQFVCMIEHGVDIKSQLEFGASKSDQAMAQLLQYNCYARYREGAKTFRHSKERETPFPVFMGMSIYAKTRKKVLIDLLHDHSLTIPYDRVLEISAQLGDAAVGKNIEEGVVCPSVLRKRLFTTAAMDNIDHNPTATTATTSFHGTSVSLFQYPTQANDGEKRESFEIRNFNVKKVPELPETSTNIHPAAFTSKNPSPPRTENPTNIKTDQTSLKLSDETEWLDKVSSIEQMDVNLSISWPAFEESICSLLPLLRESAHSVATIRHVMNRVKDTVAYLNPGQTPVIAADQPLYAMAKQIQWQWPNLYGEDKFVIMFGGLHIEMAALKSIGTLLQSSGWTGALIEADLATSGTAESFLHASSVTRTRKLHQVTACSLYNLLKEAYSYYCSDDDGVQRAVLSFEMWCEKRKEDIPQFAFWYFILSMELPYHLSEHSEKQILVYIVRH